MYWGKILLVVAIGILCINARRLQRRPKQICQRPVRVPPCNCPPIDIQCGCKSILDPIYGAFGPCNCQNICLDEILNYRYADTYGTLNPEVSNYARVPAIKLPKIIPDFDCGPLPVINLPCLFDYPDYPCQAMPPFGLPCSCQGAVTSCQFVEPPCRLQRPIVEYLAPEVPSPILKVPYGDYYLPAPKCQPYGCPPKIECGCQMNMPCGCQGMPCSCDNGRTLPYGSPCGCQNLANCGCPNIMLYGPQMPLQDAPCPCPTCQLSPVELPVFGYNCQSLPPPVIDCCGKYLRQVTLQPPFL